jgi:4-amino-4-deoxy-L-arabinose transferase-like glycosyltransferase
MSSSLGRIGAIARTTFTELARLRVFYVLVLFALVLIISSSFIARISFQQELQVTRDIALGAINFFLSMLAIVATAQLLPRDLEDRVIYSVLAKPVRLYDGKIFWHPRIARDLPYRHECSLSGCDSSAGRIRGAGNNAANYAIAS